MPKIKVKNLEIKYLDQGQGPILLILHGWGSSLKSYGQLIPLLTKDFRVIMPELPGFGESEEPQEAWSLDEYVSFVKDFVETHCNASLQEPLQKLHVYAHSFGARIAIRWLSAGEESVEKLVMCGAAGIKDELSTRQKSASKLSKLSKLVPNFLAKPLKKVLYKIAGSSDYIKASPVMKETLQLVVAQDLSPYLEKINVLTLLVWGRGDTYTPLRHGQFMHEKIKDSKLVVLEDAKHGVHLQQPEKLARLISDFLITKH
ncbi:MAG: alpha/beta hydrolase [Candidatus Gracilibacteria bacterium]|nr:alpha/beta hydrolase [Candidatus Gracilibacteria bacterium]